MEWLTTKTEYEGFPLYLRIPNYDNIWQFKSRFQNLILITHHFDKVTENGLPTSDYNKTLIDFDEETVNLITDNGIIFLIETYGGARNYWFYDKDKEHTIKAFEILKNQHQHKNIELEISHDPEWNFITDYPVKLYKSESKS